MLRPRREGRITALIRAGTTTVLSDAAKALKKERCRVTFEPHVNLCHAIPHATEDEVLDCLEWAWNFEHGTLNVDSRWNIIIMRADLHHWWDQKGFLLLPMPSELEAMYLKFSAHPPGTRIWLNSPYLTDPNRSYTYYLIPTFKMERASLTRQTPRTTHIPLKADGVDRARLTNSWWPFTTLGAIQSQTAPEFVIFKAGLELARMVLDNRVDSKEPDRRGELAAAIQTPGSIYTKDHLRMVEALFNWWMIDPPASFVKEESDGRPDGFDDPTAVQDRKGLEYYGLRPHPTRTAR